MGTAINRREFVRCGALAGACALAPRELTAAASARLTPGEFRDRLSGPIVSIPTPFTSDFRLDEDGVRRMIAMDLQHDITIFELTAGDSQYSYLAYEEIKQLAQTVVAAAGERGMTVIGTGPWWTARAIDFARFVESIGGTALQVLKPAAEDKDVVDYYQAIADAVRLPIVLHGNFSVPLLEELVAIESVVALKEDVSMEYYVNGEIRFGKRINCFSGGGLDWFMVAQPYGAKAYFDSYATFAPEITVRFRDAVVRGDYAAERAIIEQYDHPFITNFSAPFWRATLEYFGIAGRYLRAPQHSYSEAEMPQVKSFYDKVGLQPRRKGA